MYCPEATIELKSGGSHDCVNFIFILHVFICERLSPSSFFSHYSLMDQLIKVMQMTSIHGVYCVTLVAVMRKSIPKPCAVDAWKPQECTLNETGNR